MRLGLDKQAVSLLCILCCGSNRAQPVRAQHHLHAGKEDCLTSPTLEGASSQRIDTSQLLDWVVPPDSQYKLGCLHLPRLNYRRESGIKSSVKPAGEDQEEHTTHMHMHHYCNANEPAVPGGTMTSESNAKISLTSVFQCLRQDSTWSPPALNTASAMAALR